MRAFRGERRHWIGKAVPRPHPKRWQPAGEPNTELSRVAGRLPAQRADVFLANVKSPRVEGLDAPSATYEPRLATRLMIPIRFDSGSATMPITSPGELSRSGA